MSSYSPSLTSALKSVDEDAFVHRLDGTLISQTSSRRIIADMLQRLGVQRGMRVLEIGSGSAYSTALLAHLVGRDGHIVSIDVVKDLVERARLMLPAQGFSNTTLICADGAEGAPGNEPFDRVIAWATAPYLPTAWTTQTSPAGTIVAPIALAPISKTGIGTRIHLLDDGTPRVDQLFSAGFVELHDEEVDQWIIPPYDVDVLNHGDPRGPSWLSAAWLRTPDHNHAGLSILNSLVSDRHTMPGPLNPGEDATDFRAWLLATQPDGLTTAALGGPMWRIGHTSPDGAALTDIRTATETITAGRPDIANVLIQWADRWRDAGCPGLNNLTPRLIASHNGWELRADINTSPAPPAETA